MIRLKSPVLRLESLEERSVPASFGHPWLDGRHVTLSFAGDGTLISGVGSSLSTALNPIGLEAAKVELLRAFQSWTVHANLNVGLVGDSNVKFGSAGAIQGDPRFGDIRIGARPLAPDVLAITAPFSLLTPNSGDLILNSAKPFVKGNVTGKYDLFTLMMQESGHAFGIGNSIDQNSVMFEEYGTVRSGLSEGDIVEIRALYGARANDGFEGSDGNNTVAAATTYSGALEADLSNASDADVYRYTADSTAGRYFRLRASGLSLVSARVEVLDSTGQSIAVAETTNPLQNDIAVYVDELVEGQTYYVRVSAARSDVFGVGGYRLEIDTSSDSSSDPDAYEHVDTESSDNNTVATAGQPTISNGPYNYSFRSTLHDTSDVDFFRVRSPAGGPSKLTVTVSGVGQTWFNPNVDLYTAAGVRLTPKVLTHTDSSIVLSLDATTGNTDYLIRVASGNASTGNYDLVADFRAVHTPRLMGATGSLSSFFSSTSATMNVWQSQTVQINLLASRQDGTNTFALIRIYDSLNREVFALYAETGVRSTSHVFLRRGNYRVEVRTLDGPIDFSLTMFTVSDPIGVVPTVPPEGDSGDVLPQQPPDTTVAIKPPLGPPPNTIWF